MDKDRIKEFLKEAGHEAWGFIKVFVCSAAVTLFVTSYLIMLVIVPTESMEPTVDTGSIMFCSRVSYWKKSPQAGDVVVFRLDDDKTYYTKRVVGEPGDIVEINGGITYVNGTEYDEPWLAEKADELDFGPFVVPAGKYFCMGDNRNYSYDCRYWDQHYISEEEIYAKAKVVISPDGSFRRVASAPVKEDTNAER